MFKAIKKISYISATLFIMSIVFILMAQKFDWPVSTMILPIFLIIFILTALSILIVSISGILETIKKTGKKSFCKKFITKWLFVYAILYAAAFLKKNIDMSIILGSSFILAIFSNYHEAKLP